MVLEKFLDPICVYDLQGKSLYASQKLLQLLQITTQPLDFFRYFSAQAIAPDQLQSYWQQALQTDNVSFTCHPSHLEVPLQCHLQFLPQERCLVLTVETLKVEPISSDPAPLLTQYEKTVLTLLERSSSAIALIDAAGTILKCNQRLLGLLKTQSRKFLNLEAFVHPDDRTIDNNLKLRLFHGDLDSYTMEKRLITQNHDIVWINYTISRLNQTNPDSFDKTLFVVLLEDITEQCKLYEALVRTEEKWKTFVLNSSHLFLQISDVGRILYLSPAVERVLEYQEEELLDRPILDLIHPHDLPEFKLIFAQWLQGNSTHTNLECRWRTKSARWMYLYLQGQRFPMALGMEGIAISGCNISDRKHLEIELEASEKKIKSLTSERPWQSVKGSPGSKSAMNYYYN
ncbi:MAG: PAS domain-containing protein [Leptolyngbyaceae cyanobacterium bins.302]|nr:PAS domain-containing protein [Leptolyngbyaceae cyanobacterium bins.302]